MLDIIKRMERLAELEYDKMSQPGGKLKCDCGRIFDPDKEGGTVSPNPYAMPVCGECLEEAYNRYEEQNSNDRITNN